MLKTKQNKIKTEVEQQSLRKCGLRTQRKNEDIISQHRGKPWMTLSHLIAIKFPLSLQLACENLISTLCPSSWETTKLCYYMLLVKMAGHRASPLPKKSNVSSPHPGEQVLGTVRFQHLDTARRALFLWISVI